MFEVIRATRVMETLLKVQVDTSRWSLASVGIKSKVMFYYKEQILKCNFCYHVNRTKKTMWCVTLYRSSPLFSNSGDGDGDAAPGDRCGGVPRAALPPPLQHAGHPGLRVPLRETMNTYGSFVNPMALYRLSITGLIKRSMTILASWPCIWVIAQYIWV